MGFKSKEKYIDKGLQNGTNMIGVKEVINAASTKELMKKHLRFVFNNQETWQGWTLKKQLSVAIVSKYMAP